MSYLHVNASVEAKRRGLEEGSAMIPKQSEPWDLPVYNMIL